jgi:pilus assembly protein Flp/PilA
MHQLTKAVRTFIADEGGVTALEYGMIAALIAAVIVAAVTTAGTKIEIAFNKIKDALP